MGFGFMDFNLWILACFCGVRGRGLEGWDTEDVQKRA